MGAIEQRIMGSGKIRSTVEVEGRLFLSPGTIFPFEHDSIVLWTEAHLNRLTRFIVVHMCTR